MSLAAFQTALADLAASPALVTLVRADAATLPARYALSEKEARRLTAIAASRGMEANCILYRANRLAPVALNLPETCTALGDDLAGLLSEYWVAEPRTDVHFLLEADRFARFLGSHPALTAAARTALAPEAAIVAARLAASRALAV